MPPSRSGRQFAGVPVCTDDGWGNEAFVEVTARTETAETALGALIEADVYEWTDELDHDRIAPDPTRSAYKEGGDGDVPCAQDDPAKRGEYWIFDISKAWKR